MAGPVWERDSGEYRVALYEYRDRRPGRAPRFVSLHTWRTPGADAPSRTACGGDLALALADCETHWRRYLAGEVRAPDPPPLTVGKLIDAFCARTERRDGRPIVDATREAYRYHLGHLKAETGGGALALDRLGRVHVERALLRLPAQSSRRAIMLDCRACLRWGAERWPDVVRDVTRGMHVHVEQEIRPWFRRPEIPVFLAGCRPSHQIRAALLIQTGLRVGEALALRWEWVHRGGIGRAVLSVPAVDRVSGFHCKGKRARAVPLSRAAEAALDAAREHWGPTGYVLHGEPSPPSRTGWWHDQNEACERAGVPHVDVHGLRRTAGALWLLAGVGIHTVSRWLGHSSVLTTERSYAGLDEAAALAAMDSVDAAEELPTVPARELARDPTDQPIGQ